MKLNPLLCDIIISEGMLDVRRNLDVTLLYPLR